MTAIIPSSLTKATDKSNSIGLADITALSKNKKIIAILQELELVVNKDQDDLPVQCLALILVLNEEKRIPKKVWSHVKSTLLLYELASLTIIALSFSPDIAPHVVKQILPHIRVTKNDITEKPDIARLLKTTNMGQIQHISALVAATHKNIDLALITKERELINNSLNQLTKKTTKIKLKI